LLRKLIVKAGKVAESPEHSESINNEIKEGKKMLKAELKNLVRKVLTMVNEVPGADYLPIPECFYDALQKSLVTRVAHIFEWTDIDAREHFGKFWRDLEAGDESLFAEGKILAKRLKAVTQHTLARAGNEIVQDITSKEVALRVLGETAIGAANMVYNAPEALGSAAFSITETAGFQLVSGASSLLGTVGGFFNEVSTAASLGLSTM